jgi:hypothetical protein
MESLRRLINRLEVAKYFNTDMSKEYKQAFAVGETISVKLPQRYTIRDGVTYVAQALDRKKTDITLNQIFGIDFEWDSVEKVLEMERGEERVRKEYIEPAMDQLAQEIDSRCAQYAYQNSPNIAGALGTTPTSMTPFHDARRKLVELAVSAGTKGMIISPNMHSTLGANLTTLLNPQREVSDLFLEGLLGRAAGFKWHESMSLYSHTAGTMTASDVTVSAYTEGATEITLASAAVGATLKKGDVISFTTPMACNPSTRRSIGRAKTVVLTQDCTIGAGGSATAYIYPALYGPNHQYQNVDVLPTSAHVVVLFPDTTTPSAKYGINALALNRDAFALVSVPLVKPKAVEIAETMRDPQTGISISFIRQFDAENLRWINRFDVLMGFGRLYAENCSLRVLSLT